MLISAFRQTNLARGAAHGRKQKMQKGKLLLASIAAMLVATPAFAQTAVKIGVLNDRSGIYADLAGEGSVRSEEHTSELQSLMRISYAVFCLKKTKSTIDIQTKNTYQK